MFLCSWILLLYLQGVLNCSGGGSDPPATTAPPTTTVPTGGWGTVAGIVRPHKTRYRSTRCARIAIMFSGTTISTLCAGSEKQIQLV